MAKEIDTAKKFQDPFPDDEEEYELKRSFSELNLFDDDPPSRTIPEEVSRNEVIIQNYIADNRKTGPNFQYSTKKFKDILNQNEHGENIAGRTPSREQSRLIHIDRNRLDSSSSELGLSTTNHRQLGNLFGTSSSPSISSSGFKSDFQTADQVDPMECSFNPTCFRLNSYRTPEDLIPLIKKLSGDRCFQDFFVSTIRGKQDMNSYQINVIDKETGATLGNIHITEEQFRKARADGCFDHFLSMFLLNPPDSSADLTQLADEKEKK
ncbi:unnamed protein product [Hermetia illucens]|uniref:Uncharacterized protein n=1 Tax=Hermetia illucens TaxID=343691 RepID=A0A7R8UF15_HERIL|nr:unnamed protein product [Hermetia illucens]